jgi:hypothetical protein
MEPVTMEKIGVRQGLAIPGSDKGLAPVAKIR